MLRRIWFTRCCRWLWDISFYLTWYYIIFLVIKIQDKNDRCFLNWMSVVAPLKQNLPHINSTLLRRTHKTLTLAFHKSRVFRPRVSVSGHYTIHPVDSLLISFMTQFYFIVFCYICRFVKDHFLLVYFSKSMFVVIYSLKRHSNSPTLLHVNTLLHILVHKTSMNTPSFYLLWQKGIFI